MQSEQQELITMLEDSARYFIKDHCQQATNNDALWPAMAELGWLALALPESHQGAGLGLAEITALTRLFGLSALSTRFVSQCILPSYILAKADINNDAVQALCESLSEGRQNLTLAWQEQRGQTEYLAIHSKLDENFVLQGNKCFVPSCDNAEQILVTAEMNHEKVIVVVDRSLAGVTIDIDFQSPLGFGNIHFDQVKLNPAAILLRGETAEQALNNSIHAGQLAVAAELEGLASGCLEKTLDHIKTRKQFKQSIGSFQAIRHRCVDLLMATRLAESSWRRAVRNSKLEPAEQLEQIYAAKSRAADTAFKVAKESVQMHGAMGFTEELGLGSYMRSALALAPWLGAARPLRQQLLKAISPKDLFQQEQTHV